MKKVLSLVVLLAACTFVLTGCNKSEVNTKTSLDLGELIGLIETHFPKSYEYSNFNLSDSLVGVEWRHVYNRMELGYLTPEYSDITDREVINSGIEDDMIYTEVKATRENWDELDILYVVNPETLNFVAANIDNGDNITNYQFSYDDITSLTFEDLEGIAETDFPTSSTYTKVIWETEESTTGDVVYPEDTPNNLTNITPDFAKIAEENFLSSGIEDGMIYTNFDVEFEDGTTGNVLYINDPETLDFLAATVESQGYYINYQYVY